MLVPAVVSVVGGHVVVVVVVVSVDGGVVVGGVNVVVVVDDVPSPGDVMTSGVGSVITGDPDPAACGWRFGVLAEVVDGVERARAAECGVARRGFALAVVVLAGSGLSPPLRLPLGGVVVPCGPAARAVEG